MYPFTPLSPTGILLTGTLSPVNMLSFTIASPDRRRMSAGTVFREGEMRETVSPGKS